MAKKPEDILKEMSDILLFAVDKAFSKKNTDKLGKKAALQLIKRTRLGFGVDETSGNQKRLKPLSASYKDVRRGKLRFFTNKKTNQIFTVGDSTKSKPSSSSKSSRPSKGSKGVGKPKKKKKNSKEKRLARLSGQTSPGKSNLTATGGMLNSIRGFGRRQKIIIEVPDKTHGPDLFGKSTTKTHAELARIHQKGATARHPSGVSIKIPQRRFFALSNAEQKGVIKQVRQFILAITRSKLG